MNLALFDFDGTITSADTFIPFLRYSTPPVRLVAGGALLSPIMAGYRLGLVAGRTGRPLAARVAFCGADAAAIRGAGERFARDVLPGLVRRRALERIAWHQQQGDTVVVVSASLDVYLARWCEAAGVDVICTRLEERRGRFTGRYVGGDCTGAEKPRRVRERYDLRRYPIVYAYGDTDEDTDMLEIAHERYFRWVRVAGSTAATA